MRAAACFIPVCLYAGVVFGQDRPDEDIDLQGITDAYLGYPDEDANYEDLYENLVQVLASPYDLNKITREELELLHVLSDGQIENFLAYRAEQGILLDVHELQVIPAFTPEVIARLIPYLRVSPMKSSQTLLQRIFSSGHSYVIARYARTLETQRGFDKTSRSDATFNGSPDKLYFRLRSALAGDFSLGVTGEKDAGERIVFAPDRHQLGFDFTSWHLRLQNKGKLKNLIVGDYQTQFGQGLLLGGAFGLGKGGESVTTARKSNAGFLPYTSLQESNYQRGAAFTLQAEGPFRLSAFYSRTLRDANVAGEADSLTLTSFQTTGYHRTLTEIEKRKQVGEQGYGVILQYVKNNLDAGFIAHAISFDTPVKRKPTLYNQGAFKGTQNLNTGIFLNYRFRNLLLFGEFGQSVGAGRAGLAGILISPHPVFDLVVLYRNYMRNFHAFYSNAFSESTLPQNERGTYWGWKYRINRHYNLSGYVDLFAFPGLGFRRYAPSTGSEWLLRGNYSPARKVTVFLQFREERKSRNHPGDTRLYHVSEGVKRNLTLNLDHAAAERIRLKSRIQYNHYQIGEQSTKGIAVIQDVSFATGPFKLTARHALYDTDHYDNRHYVHEQDAWLAYSLPVYAGAGVRNYALLEYKLHKQLTLWVRYARTRVIDTNEIGTGPDVIAGNTRNDVKFQVRFKF